MTREAYEYAEGHGPDEIATGMLADLDSQLDGDIRTGDVFSFLDYLIGEHHLLDDSY